MRRFPCVVALIGCATLTACQTDSAGPTTGTATPTHRPSAAKPPTARSAPARPKPVRLCPNPPPKNGALSDQGESVGRIGRSSSTLIDEQGRLYCLAVVAAARRGAAVVVTVRVVSRRAAPISMDADVAVTVSLAYGPSGTVAARDYSAGNAIRGVLPPGGALTGTYGFSVPAGRRAVTVTAGPVNGDGFAWTGQA